MLFFNLRGIPWHDDESRDQGVITDQTLTWEGGGAQCLKNKGEGDILC